MLSFTAAAVSMRHAHHALPEALRLNAPAVSPYIALPKWVKRRTLITVGAAQGPFGGFAQCQPCDSG
jgi:hypothetical protein